MTENQSKTREIIIIISVSITIAFQSGKHCHMYVNEINTN
jgi:hypothetical protein